jgi:alkylation response protein AidB-like acyl-CoA dehydrogenase
MNVLNGGRIGIASQALGIATGAYEIALKYSKKSIWKRDFQSSSYCL